MAPDRSRPPRTPRGRGARRTGMHGYQQRPRRSPAVVVAIVVAVVVALAAVAVIVVAVAFARSPEAAGYDRATIRACEAAEAFHGGGGAAGDVLEAASVSERRELRELAERWASDGSAVGGIREQTGALKVSTWCVDHGMG